MQDEDIISDYIHTCGRYGEGWSALDDLADCEPDRALDLIIRIVGDERSFRNDELMQNIAAGALEDLLSKHGQKVIGRIEEEARRNEKFTSLLGGVWRNEIAHDVWTRICLIRKDGVW